MGVLNLDMIFWDSVGGPTLRLHTRTTGNSGYAGDRAIADIFTNVVANYGMAANLTPIERAVVTGRMLDRGIQVQTVLRVLS